MRTVPLLLADFYKVCHQAQYDNRITRLVSYFTPRMSRLNQKEVVMFGLQGFIKEFLIEYFNTNFFELDEDEVINEYERILKYAIGEGTYNSDCVRSLHKLGYLPIEICAIEEGTLVPMGVPIIQLTNTHPNFAWLSGALETLFSCELWHPMISATVGYMYRQIVNKYYGLTVEDNVPRNSALGDFSLRGQESLHSGIKSSAGWCMSFINSATIPVIPYLEEYYNCDSSKEIVVKGAVSTEHSVMCSSATIDGDEITMVKRLLTEVYPNTSFSMVSDSYDYWNLVEEILPACRKEIMAHNGTLLVRGDSGDPIEIVTETVFRLWELFGGSVNSKGYKVLDPHVKAIYGDSITIQRAEKIYTILMENGFACNNVALGVGSFSMQCIEEDGMLKPFTRDTFSTAMKATYGEIGNASFEIFKNPKTDTGHFKKSQKGCCIVQKNDNGKLIYFDKLTYAETKAKDLVNYLVPIFKDGEMLKETSLKEIRGKLNGGMF